MIVRMWEVRAYPEGFADLLSWVCEVAVPQVEHHPRHVSSEIFSSTDHRIVVISKWHGCAPEPMADPPGHLLASQPHTWDFAQVDR